MKLHLIYTFDIPTSKINGAESIPDLLFLKYSIHTAIRQWTGNSFRITVYTHQPELLSRLLSIFSDRINITQLDQQFKTVKQEFKHKATERFNNIGHSRIFLIPYLLEQHPDESVLYLDNDTYFNDLDSWKKLANTIDPLACRREEGHTIRKWVKLSKPICRVNPQSHPYLGAKWTTINNGILFFPNNTSSRRIAGEVQQVYSDLVAADGNRYLFDQVAVSVVWKFNPQCSTFECQKINIIHYYRWKYTDPVTLAKFSAGVQKIIDTITAKGQHDAQKEHDIEKERIVE